MSDENNKIEKLDKETSNKMQKELLERKERVSKDLADITGGEGASAKFPDFGDKTDENAQEIGEYSTNIATEKVLESTLRDIDNSLDRIKKGSYGICKYCKKPIGKKRMMARPVASACVECKTKLQSQI